MTIAVLLGAGAEFYLAIDTLIVILCMLESGLSMTLKKEGVTNVFTHFMEGDLFNTVLEGANLALLLAIITDTLPAHSMTKAAFHLPKIAGKYYIFTCTENSINMPWFLKDFVPVAGMV